MMRRLLLPAVLLLTTACSKVVDVYYTTEYPVVRLDAEVSVAPDPDGGETADEAAEALADAIRSTVLHEAPVEAGGSYRLDFSLADGGSLFVVPAAGSEALAGTFTKVPASSQLTFDYGEQHYTAQLSTWLDEAAGPCVRFEVDLTEAFRERLGNDRIESVIRYEYTAHPRD